MDEKEKLEFENELKNLIDFTNKLFDEKDFSYQNIIELFVVGLADSVSKYPIGELSINQNTAIKFYRAHSYEREKKLELLLMYIVLLVRFESIGEHYEDSFFDIGKEILSPLMKCAFEKRIISYLQEVILKIKSKNNLIRTYSSLFFLHKMKVDHLEKDITIKDKELSKISNDIKIKIEEIKKKNITIRELAIQISEYEKMSRWATVPGVFHFIYGEKLQNQSFNRNRYKTSENIQTEIESRIRGTHRKLKSMGSEPILKPHREGNYYRLPDIVEAVIQCGYVVELNRETIINNMNLTANSKTESELKRDNKISERNE